MLLGKLSQIFNQKENRSYLSILKKCLHTVAFQCYVYFEASKKYIQKYNFTPTALNHQQTNDN